MIIQSIDRAIHVLQTLEGARHLGVSEIAERTGLSKPTVHSILKTLMVRSVVEQDPETGKYALGAALLRLGNVYLDNHELRARSLRWADELAQRTGYSVRVGVLLGHDVVVVHHAFRPDGTAQIREVGISIPAHASSLGKAILAYQPAVTAEVNAAPLRRLTSRTITSAETLSRELEQVRARGTATEKDEAVLGESGVAAAVFARAGQAVGAIGLTVPTSRLVKGTEADLADAVREAARAISRELGARTWPGQVA